MTSTAPLPLRRHLDVVRELLAPLDGLTLLDIGCGDGSLVRALAHDGAVPTGLEIDERALAPARAAPRVGAERYIEGRAEAIPAPDGAFDAVVFFNSLHHVPASHMTGALAEAARVVRPGGVILVVEPLAEGPYFEVAQPVEDETVVRARAYEVIRDAIGGVLEGERELIYAVPMQFADFEEWAARFLAVDPGRRDALEANRAMLAERFARLATSEGGAFTFRQPARANLLRHR